MKCEYLNDKCWVETSEDGTSTKTGYSDEEYVEEEVRLGGKRDSDDEPSGDRRG